MDVIYFLLGALLGAAVLELIHGRRAKSPRAKTRDEIRDEWIKSRRFWDGAPDPGGDHE